MQTGHRSRPTVAHADAGMDVQKGQEASSRGKGEDYLGIWGEHYHNSNTNTDAMSLQYADIVIIINGIEMGAM